MERWAVRHIHIFWSAHQRNFVFAFVGEGPCWVQPYLSMLPRPQSTATLVEAFMQNKEVCKLIFATSTIRMSKCRFNCISIYAFKVTYWRCSRCLLTFFLVVSCIIFAGRRWIKQMFIGAFLIPAMVCGTAFFINFIAIYYHASRAIPFGTMVSSSSALYSV